MAGWGVTSVAPYAKDLITKAIPKRAASTGTTIAERVAVLESLLDMCKAAGDTESVTALKQVYIGMTPRTEG